MKGKLRALFSKKKKKKNAAAPPIQQPIDENQVIELKGRQIQKKVFPEIGMSVLELAMKHKVDWSSNCKRGICARCRCRVTEGQDYLTPPNEAEINRLDPEEIEEGYRLGCQARIADSGEISVTHQTYF